MLPMNAGLASSPTSAAPDHGEGGAGVRDLRREPGHHLLRIGARRPRRGARKHLGHRAFEAGHVGRGLVQAVLEDECRHAALGQRAGDIPSFVLHRQSSETAPGRNHDRGAAGLGPVGQERRDRRDRDVASELAAILGVPRFLSGSIGERAGADLDRTRLIGDGDRRHLVVRLPKNGPRERTGGHQNRRPERDPKCRNECRTLGHGCLTSSWGLLGSRPRVLEIVTHDENRERLVLQPQRGKLGAGRRQLTMVYRDPSPRAQSRGFTYSIG
jgi:hypothetical protein